MAISCSLTQKLVTARDMLAVMRNDGRCDGKEAECERMDREVILVR